MPSERTVKSAKRQLREGKSPKTAAGEFVREEIEHVRQGKHGARSPQQAIAIGLSEARRSGIPVPAGKKASAATKKKAKREIEKGRSASAKKTSSKRSSARKQALKREPKTTTSHAALSRHAKSAAGQRKGSKSGSRKAA